MKKQLAELVREAKEKHIYSDEIAQYLIDRGVVIEKHGVWIEHFRFGCWHYDCPFCDDGYATKERDIDKPNYCHNCGARLTEESDAQKK